jgi:succinoglycan biosynthesis transport protein ExoP
MSLILFIKLIFKNIKLLILVPLVLAITIYYFTRAEKKIFTSQTVVYTGIASGYTLNGSNRPDYFSTSNAFDNLLSIINSRETKEEVAIKLLASHLFLKKQDPTILGSTTYESLHKIIPDSLQKKLVKPTFEETQAAVTDYMQSSEDNTVYKLINSDNPFYSINALKGITALRISSSDLIQISYTTEDAAVCKHTLELLIETFMRKHKLLREGQTESVIAYFEQETKKSFERLDSSEQMFLEFNKQNDIINYYEQTKAVAGERENLYALNHVLEMDRMANESALSKVNKDLEGRTDQALYGDEIIKERQNLSDLYNKIALNEVLGNKSDSGQKAQLDSLKNLSSAREANLKSTIGKLYIQTTTPGGIPSKEMLDEWMKTTLSYEQSKARLTVMDKRKKEFEEEYSKFAPLGAMLKKIERQITVAEQEYLEMLHDLNLARLMQHNNELTSKLTIVDPPYLPLVPNASKRIFQIIIGAFAGFIIVLAILLINFLLNKTLQQPTRASKITGLPLLGLYPLFQKNLSFIRKANMRITQQFLSKIDLKKKPLVIGVVSIEGREGKSTIIDIWQKGLSEMGYRVKHTSWNDASFQHFEGITFLEFPELNNLVYTSETLPHLDYSFLICRANRIWGRIDTELIENFSRVTKTTPYSILNGVENDYAEEYVGEVPKRRNFFRSVAKKIIKREFGNQSVISKRQKKIYEYDEVQ